jgi:hypothetical protein
MSKKILFNYYIFIDYSKNLLGYNIISKENINKLISKIGKFKHYSKIQHKKEYLRSIKKFIKKEKINSFFEKIKIRSLKENINLFIEIAEFIKFHKNCIIFISVDNFQYLKFRKIINLIDGEKIKIVKESQLKKNSIEYKLSLIIDTQLNIKRKQDE